jgi:hypothetical protein
MKIKSHIVCGSVARGRDEWTEQAKSRSKDPGEFGRRLARWTLQALQTDGYERVLMFTPEGVQC